MGFEKFYFPQLTLIKILLTEGTISSKQRAADLPDRSLDFFRSIHNKRFQIDLLALQSLLFDSQKDEPTALKALTESLTIAEPADSIRPFVDLGPPMADLLKRLRKQGITVTCIEKLLAAFRQEGEQTVVLETHDQPTIPPHERRHTSPLSQPLAEPLTHREHDVLDFLAQRLSTKEIAEKLYISTTTVNTCLRNIYGKLDINKRREAVEKAKKIGILSWGDIVGP